MSRKVPPECAGTATISVSQRSSAGEAGLQHELRFQVRPAAPAAGAACEHRYTVGCGVSTIHKGNGLGKGFLNRMNEPRLLAPGAIAGDKLQLDRRPRARACVVDG